MTTHLSLERLGSPFAPTLPRTDARRVRLVGGAVLLGALGGVLGLVTGTVIAFATGLFQFC